MESKTRSFYNLVASGGLLSWCEGHLAGLAEKAARNGSLHQPSRRHLGPFDNPLNNVAVLFGGVPANNGTPLADTWTFNAAWTQSVAGPTARHVHAMATLNTRSFDGTAWTQINVVGPAARFGHAMATMP